MPDSEPLYGDPVPPNPLDPGNRRAEKMKGKEMDEDMMGIDIPMPEGFQPPKGHKPGKEFEALATLKVNDDGDLCLLKLDGTDVVPEENQPQGEGSEGTDDTGGEPEGGNQGESAVDSMRQNLPSLGIPSGTRI